MLLWCLPGRRALALMVCVVRQLSAATASAGAATVQELRHAMPGIVLVSDSAALGGITGLDKGVRGLW